MPVFYVGMTKYKSNPGISQMCVLCDQFEVEDARHFILRCSYFSSERLAMLNEIDCIEDGSGRVLFDSNDDMLYTILGKPHKDLGCDQMMAIWLIILRYVPAMYRKNVKIKSGIG